MTDGVGCFCSGDPQAQVLYLWEYIIDIPRSAQHFKLSACGCNDSVPINRLLFGVCALSFAGALRSLDRPLIPVMEEFFPFDSVLRPRDYLEKPGSRPYRARPSPGLAF
jgi:hypothetical protein